MDDSPVVLDLLRILLTAAGWDVATYSEVAALELRLRAWCPDVILLDVGMPGVGLEGLRQRVVLLHVATGAKVLLHSARDAAELAQLAQRSGADGAVPKSGDPTALLRLLQRCVGEAT
ncbi:MAG: response regulator [Sandaracinaceae bacterium]|nr:response regulator [Sandaracinaceae bacterium]